jgi:hypothetical protein
MPGLWDSIPVSKRGKTYAELAMFQWNEYHEILPMPVFDKPEVYIDAPDYEDDHIDEINEEISSNTDIKEKD